MSLGIAFKGPEGIVLAADSRVTLTAEIHQGGEKRLLPATFDNATKLLQVNGHDYVGAVTYGAGTIGSREVRTAHSFLPEFEDELSKQKEGRLSVEEFAQKLGEFFMRQWTETMPQEYSGPDMLFIIGGYDEGAPYGRVFRMAIPSSPIPEEQQAKGFGVTWGGQLESTNRLMKGFDPRVPLIVQQCLGITDEKISELEQQLEKSLMIPIPYQFLPLQDCVDLSVFLIRTTMELQRWTVGIRGVGGAIDVATITRTGGFQPIQRKTIVAERRTA